VIRTYKCRIYPNKTQAGLLNRALYLCRWLYNSALEHSIWVYQATRGSVTCREQQDELPGIRGEIAAFKEVHRQVLQEVLKGGWTGHLQLFLDVSNQKRNLVFPVSKAKTGLIRFAIPSRGSD